MIHHLPCLIYSTVDIYKLVLTARMLLFRSYFIMWLIYVIA